MSVDYNTATIAIIGGGKMAAALVGGLRKSGIEPTRITVTNRSPEQSREWRAQFGVHATDDNAAAAAGADVVVLAVKPQDLSAAASQIAAACAARRPLVLSTAAGVRMETIAAALGGYSNIVRTMPNRPALIGKGMTALFAGPEIAAADRELAERILGAVGETVWLEREEQMDVATALSGSGPAYFFRLIELLEQAGEQHGLPRETARKLAVRTAYGAGCMARETGADPAVLRAEVTSPGGTTAAALSVLENADLRGIVHRAIEAARRRAEELANKA